MLTILPHDCSETVNSVSNRYFCKFARMVSPSHRTELHLYHILSEKKCPVLLLITAAFIPYLRQYEYGYHLKENHCHRFVNMDGTLHFCTYCKTPNRQLDGDTFCILIFYLDVVQPKLEPEYTVFMSTRPNLH